MLIPENREKLEALCLFHDQKLVMGYQISVIWADGKTGIHGSTGKQIHACI